MARTNIDIDKDLIEEGLRLTECKTKKELVHLALEELVKRRARKKLLELEGKIDWEGSLDEMRESRV